VEDVVADVEEQLESVSEMTRILSNTHSTNSMSCADVDEDELMAELDGLLLEQQQIHNISQMNTSDGHNTCDTREISTETSDIHPGSTEPSDIKQGERFDDIPLQISGPAPALSRSQLKKKSRHNKKTAENVVESDTDKEALMMMT
jgi:hypothetical protein